MKKQIALIPLLALLTSCSLGSVSYEIYTRKVSNSRALIGDLFVEYVLDGDDPFRVQNISDHDVNVEIHYVYYDMMEETPSYKDLKPYEGDDKNLVLSAGELHCYSFYVKRCLTVRMNNFEYTLYDPSAEPSNQ